MRLLHAKDLVFKEFVGDSIPKYATVSHRWGDDELSYQGFLKDKGAYRDGHLQGYGWTKIVKACELTLDHGLEWVWLDTVCINKESSAELTEAINSMYQWYKKGSACFVFLPDVHNLESCTCGLSSKSTLVASNEAPAYWSNSLGYGTKKPRTPPSVYAFSPFYEEEFKTSCWFERSWTLQELIAPTDPVFLNSEFQYIGTRSSLAPLISDVTRIRPECLGNDDSIRLPPSRVCVAERMRWASQRYATRMEDKAYSLLGLFDVNMPLLYGEGHRAFRRLQLEIIKQSSDESILAWHRDVGDTRFALAADADGFAFTSIHAADWIPRKHFEFTNMGIRFSVPISRPSLDKIVEAYRGLGGRSSTLALFPLNCRSNYDGLFTESLDGHSGKVALLLRVYANEEELGLKLLQAWRWAGGLCVYKNRSRRLDGSSVKIMKKPNDLTWSSEGNGEWINIRSGKSAKFDIVIGNTRHRTEEEYSLYIETE